MTYDEAKEEVFRITDSIKRRELIKMLAFRATVIAVVFLFMAWGFAAIAEQSRQYDSLREVQMQRLQKRIEHMFAAVHALEKAKTDPERIAIYREEFEYALREARTP